MRNLKRVLSLAMASVMLLGMMVIGAGAASKTAADLTDSDKITNKEAVTLLVDLGIIEGKPDGSYAPAETVNRATMAKLITYIMMGDVDQNAFKGTVTDLKDINGHWAEGYIKYCYSNGIIVGDGAGHFMPDQPVTTVAAAKMLLVAIGYNAKDRGYEGSNSWSINIMRDAQTTSVSSTEVRALTNGLSVSATDALSRDNAAQMIFNALFVRTVVAEYAFDMGVRYISKYNPQPSLAATTYNGLTRVTATLDGTSSGKISTATITAGLKDNTGALVTTIPSGLNKLAASSVDVGKSISFYVDSANKLISSAVIVSAGNGVIAPEGLTSGLASKAGTAKKFLKDNGLTDSTLISAITVNYFTGAGAVPPVAPFNTGANTLDVALQSIVAGDIVTLYDTNKDGVVDIINVIHKSVAKLTTDPVVKYDKTNDIDKVTIAGVIGTATDVKEVNGYEDLEKDDVILYYKDGDGNWYLEKAEIATGTVTGSKGGNEVYFNGSYYGQTGLTVPGAVGSSVSAYISAGKFNVAATAYLDNNGNILAIDNDVETASNYAVVLKTAWVVDQGVDGGSKLEAKVLYADGTTGVIILTKVNGNDIKKTGTTVSGTTITDGVITVSGTTYYGVSDSSSTGNIDETVFKYLTKDGKLQLTTVSGTKATVASANVSKGNPGVNGETATNATTYVYHTKNGTKDVFTVYTGYASAPSTTGTTNVALALNSSNRVAFAYVDATASTNVGDSSTKNYAYILGTSVSVRYVGDDTFYDLKGVLNGNADDATVTTTSNTIANLFSSTTAAATGLFEVTLNDKGYVTAATPVSVAGNWVAVASTDAANGAPSGGVLAVDGTNAGNYTYNGSEKVYIVSTGDKTLTVGTIGNIADNDTLFVEVVDAAGTPAEQVAIKTIYVITP